MQMTYTDINEYTHIHTAVIVPLSLPILKIKCCEEAYEVLYCLGALHTERALWSLSHALPVGGREA